MIRFYWLHILLLLLIIALVASLVFLLLSTASTRDKWMYWGISFATFAVMSFIVLWLCYPEEPESAAHKYKTITKNARTDVGCKTDRQKCLERTLEQKRLHEKDYHKIEAQLANDPTNTQLQTKLKNSQIQAIEDTKQANDCQSLSSNNCCIRDALNACSTMMNQSSDDVMKAQFAELRATKDPAEVLSLCNIIADRL